MVCDSMNLAMMTRAREAAALDGGNHIQASMLEDAHNYHAPIEAMAETAHKRGSSIW